MSSKLTNCIRRITLPFLLLLLALLTPLQNAAAQAYSKGASIPTSHPDWMRWISDDTSLAALSLPGTHDTMANDTEWYVTSIQRDWVLTQSAELRPQLDAGIRVLDIRARHIEDRFAIHHENYYVMANLDDVLGTAVQFLQTYPSETILMRIKQEHIEENCSRPFEETFKWYRDLPAYSSFIWRRSPERSSVYIPKMGEVRGKIVILDDFAGGTYGIKWNGESLNRQDWWQAPNPSTKWEVVSSQLAAAHSDRADVMYLNFLTASNSSYTPSAFASSVNANALSYLADGNVRRTGAMMMDFPGAGLIDAIIAHNSPYTQRPRGGSGGYRTSTQCPNGYVAVGIHGRSGLYIDRLGLKCRALNTNGSLGANFLYANPQGGDGGSPFEFQCPDGQVIVGFQGRSGGYVDRLGMYCSTPTNWQAGGPIQHVSPETGGGSGSSFTEQCWRGSLVTGLSLRVGLHIDQMQTVCSTLMPGPNYDVGVIPNTATCPSGSEMVTIHQDNEDNGNANRSSGWYGAITFSNNTTHRFCRVDGRQFNPLTTSSSDSWKHYAVLKLGHLCPIGSTQFSRYFDDEDSSNANWFSGNIYPNTSINNTKLHFCLFTSGSTPMSGFPWLGISYGVYVPGNFNSGLATGSIYMDDEDDGNENSYSAPGSIMGAAQQVISSGSNTTLRLAKVR